MVAVFAMLAAVLVAAPAQAATGKVTGVVKAQYAGKAAVPIAGVQVLFDKLNADGWSHDSAVHVVYSDSNGRYTASGLGDGQYQVRFYSPDYAATGGLGHEYYRNRWSPYGTDYVTVSGGTVTLAEVLLEQPGWVTGTVRDTSGKPLPGAQITVQDTPTSGGYIVEADSQGRYTTRQGLTKNTIPGTYVLSASMNEWPIDAPVYGRVSTPVSIVANRASTQDFVLTRQKTATFTVLDTNGAPLVGAPVHIWFKNPETGLFEDIRSGPHETDEAGRYRLVQRYDYKIKFLTPAGYTGTGVPEYWDGPNGQGAYTYAEAAVLDWTSSTVARNFTVRLGAAPAVKSGTPRVTGTPAVGKTLKADPGTWTPSGAVLSYQWLRDGIDIPGATSRTLKLTAKLAAAAITVRVTGKISGAPAVDATSPEHVVVKKGSLKKAKPRIKGKAKVGKRLRAVPGAWGPKPVKFKYQWFRGAKKIKGAKAKTYRVKKKDRGKKLTVKVTARKSGYVSATRASRKTGKIKR